jgi:hypothetical protein
VITLVGLEPLLKFVKRQGNSKMSLSKILKQIEKEFTYEEWLSIKKHHKKVGRSKKSVASSSCSQSQMSYTSARNEEAKKSSPQIKQLR